MPRLVLTPGVVSCPAHPDRTPSLAITRGPDRWLLHCHAHCDIADVLTAGELTWADLFFGPAPPRSHPPRPALPIPPGLDPEITRGLVARAEHLRARRDTWEAAWMLADLVRAWRRRATLARALATRRAPDTRWPLLHAAATLDTKATALEAALDEAVRG